MSGAFNKNTLGDLDGYMGPANQAEDFPLVARIHSLSLAPLVQSDRNYDFYVDFYVDHSFSRNDISSEIKIQGLNQMGRPVGFSGFRLQFVPTFFWINKYLFGKIKLFRCLNIFEYIYIFKYI